MSRIALNNRITALEQAPTLAKPLRIIGGLPFDPGLWWRATARLPTGHLATFERSETESLPTFLSRLRREAPGAVVTLGGLPPLPGCSVLGAIP
jgi:hypothetical protein